MGGNHLEDLKQGRPAEDLYANYPTKPPAENLFFNMSSNIEA